ncbi:MAG: endonuclease MutS2, partial [Erysipelotrichaceae bacterium]|nr:endonuclease MutS2 [Erysipelotrichaceae bacterium]
MKTIFETLEIDRLKDQIKTYCASSLGKEKVEEMDIYDDIDDLNVALNKVEEAMHLISLQDRLPLGGLSDISLLIERAKHDGTLYGDELLMIAAHLECIENIKNYMNAADVDTPLISELVDGLIGQPHLLSEIQRCILPDGKVSDHASAELYHLRKQIQSMQVNIRNKMDSMVKDSKDYLSIDNVTTRNDRLVLPVKANYKNEIQGLIHGQSGTGQTLYIEPTAIVNMNNQLAIYMQEEKEEVEKILYQLSQHVKNHYIHFHFNLEILQELDFIFAKAQYGVQWDCCRAMIDETGDILSLKQARHPFIDKKKVIANNIILEDYRMLLITGSNTGGKTVTLKTTGLLSFMALSGMVIPCSEAIVPFFDHIYVDLGDEQSIEQSLSTFSSHMHKIIDILHQSTSHSLVLIDEIGSGTDPQEGECLAEAILSKFLEKNCFVLASTHYGQLKTFASQHDAIGMASVSFDLDLMKPTYHLNLNQAGSSYALEIASQLGMDQDIIDHAYQIKESSLSDYEKLMEQLTKQQEELTLKQQQLDTLLVQNQKLEDQYQAKLKQIDHQKDQIIQQAKDEANQLVDEAKDNIDIIIKTIKESQMKQHEINQAKHDLEDIRFMDKQQLQHQDHELVLGDHVKVIRMNREGDIIEILKNKMIVVSIDGLKIKLHQDEVVFIHPKTKIKKEKK